MVDTNFPTNITNNNQCSPVSSPLPSSDFNTTPNETYFVPLRMRGQTERILPRTPSIVVTPTPDDPNQEPFIISVPDEDPSPFKSLSEKLATYCSPEIKKNSSAYDKVYLGDDKKFNGGSGECSEEEEEEGHSNGGDEDSYDTGGLKSIRSVSDIKVYDDHSTCAYVVEEQETEESSSDGEYEDLTVEGDGGIDPHQLSVIIEESDKTKSTNRSRSCSSTDCSATLANDDVVEDAQDGISDLSDDKQSDASDESDCDGDADEENSVTVRLPLKLSFSRSSNNEEITTVVVGDSETNEMGDNERNGGFNEDMGKKLQTTISDTDVSVCFSVPSRSSSVSRSLCPQVNRNDDSSGKDEVSVSVSLPMMRNKFAHQSLSLDTENNDLESLDSDTECGDTSSDEDEEEEDDEEIPVVDNQIEDIWANDASPLPVRRPLIYQPVPGDSEEDDTLTEDSDTTDSSSNVEEVKPKYTNLIKCEVRFERNTLQLSASHPIAEYLQRPMTALVSYQEPEIISNFQIRPLTPQLPASSRPSQSEMESLQNRLRSITPVRSLVCTNDNTGRASVTKSIDPETEEKINVRQRIAVFERIKSQEFSPDSPLRSGSPMNNNSNQTTPRNSFVAPNEDSGDEDDSGVTSYHSRQVSDSESENYPELRKMTAYQRAATHSRLFKLLQDECQDEDELPVTNKKPYCAKKIVHNVSITRKQNPNAIKYAETLEQRRERLSLPIGYNRSLDQDSIPSSSSASSASPTNPVSDQLINEFVQSFLKKQKHKLMRNVSMERIQAAAKRALQEDLDFDSMMGSSQEMSTVNSTPAHTPQEFKNGYSDYYDSFDRANDSATSDADLPGNRRTTDLSSLNQKIMWTAKCPRVLSSKTVNRDLSLIRESESPEPTTVAFRRSITPSLSQSPAQRYNPVWRHSYNN